MHYWRYRVWERIGMLHHIKMVDSKLKLKIIRRQQLKQIRRQRPLSKLEKLHAGKSQNFLFTEEMVECEIDSYGNESFPPKDNFNILKKRLKML